MRGRSFDYQDYNQIRIGMKASCIIIIICLFIIGAISTPSIDLSKIKAALKDDTLTISFLILGQTPSSQITQIIFSNLPPRWQSNRNQLIVPDYGSQSKYQSFRIGVRLIYSSNKYVDQQISLQFKESSIRVKSISQPVYGSLRSVRSPQLFATQDKKQKRTNDLQTDISQTQLKIEETENLLISLRSKLARLKRDLSNLKFEQPSTVSTISSNNKFTINNVLQSSKQQQIGSQASLSPREITSFRLDSFRVNDSSSSPVKLSEAPKTNFRVGDFLKTITWNPSEQTGAFTLNNLLKGNSGNLRVSDRFTIQNQLQQQPKTIINNLQTFAKNIDNRFILSNQNSQQTIQIPQNGLMISTLSTPIKKEMLAQISPNINQRCSLSQIIKPRKGRIEESIGKTALNIVDETGTKFRVLINKCTRIGSNMGIDSQRSFSEMFRPGSEIIFQGENIFKFDEYTLLKGDVLVILG